VLTPSGEKLVQIWAILLIFPLLVWIDLHPIWCPHQNEPPTTEHHKDEHSSKHTNIPAVMTQQADSADESNASEHKYCPNPLAEFGLWGNCIVRRTATDPELLFLCLAAVFTLVVAIFTRSLFVDGREKGRKELRAYVFIKSGSITGVASGQQPNVGFTIENFGKTPARKLIVLCGLGFSSSFDKLGVKEFEAVKPMGTLAPGGTVQYHRDADGRVMTEQDMLAFEQGTHSIFAYGEIRYIDFTGKDRTTKFRTMHNAKIRLLGPHLASCEDGNDAD